MDKAILFGICNTAQRFFCLGDYCRKCRCNQASECSYNKKGVYCNCGSGTTGTFCECEAPVYECFPWRAEDVEDMGMYPSPVIQKARCEDFHGHVFTQGNNQHYPGCGGCWCCKRKN